MAGVLVVLYFGFEILIFDSFRGSGFAPSLRAMVVFLGSKFSKFFRKMRKSLGNLLSSSLNVYF